jgi:uncharacterized membrane protein YkvA (DUF1232 family)
VPLAGWSVTDTRAGPSHRGFVENAHMVDTIEHQPDTNSDRARERREALDGVWRVLKRLPAYGMLVASLARDRRIPVRARLILGAGGVYLVSPVDLVPGIIPVAGQLDDLYIVLIAIRQALRTIPDDVAAEYAASSGLTTDSIDDDLAAIRRLVRIGVTDVARWGWARLERLRQRLVSP